MPVKLWSTYTRDRLEQFLLKTKIQRLLPATFLVLGLAYSSVPVQAQVNAPTMNFAEQGETMGGAPALATFNNVLYIAFRANDSSNVLWLDSSSDGVTLQGARILGAGLPVTMGSDPSIAAYAGALYVAFKSASTDNLVVCQIPDPQFGKAYCTQQNLHIVGTPSLTSYNDHLYVGFQKSPQYGEPSNQLEIAYAKEPYPTSPNTILFGNYNTYPTRIGAPPAIVGYFGVIYAAFQADDPGHNLFLQAFPLDLTSLYGSAARLAPQIGPTPALTVAGNFTNTLIIAFEANDPYQHLWFEAFDNTGLHPAIQNNAFIGGAPAETDWIPITGPYMDHEIITTGFKSYDFGNHLWIGSQLVQP